MSEKSDNKLFSRILCHILCACPVALRYHAAVAVTTRQILFTTTANAAAVSKGWSWKVAGKRGGKMYRKMPTKELRVTSFIAAPSLPFKFPFLLLLTRCLDKLKMAAFCCCCNRVTQTRLLLLLLLPLLHLLPLHQPSPTAKIEQLNGGDNG